MSKYNPRNRNHRHDEAPLSWAQQFYDRRPEPQRDVQCGFHIGEPDA